MKQPNIPLRALSLFGCLYLCLALLWAPVSGYSQPVSHGSGFYAVDSLFFTVNQSPPSGGEIHISVNCFSNDVCFTPYTGGVWLYNRNHTPNTWEDQQFTRAPYPAMFVLDTLAPRGGLKKVNVVRVRFLNHNGQITSDKAYFIGVTGQGSVFPHTLPVVHLLVDSSDAFGPEGFYGPGDGIAIPGEHLWNYKLDQSPLCRQFVPRDRVEKPCILQIIDTDNASMLYQACGIRVSGNSSRSSPNKSMAVVAREEYAEGRNRFVTDLYGDEYEAHKWIRFRSGGSVQQQGLGVHEIGERVINGLNIGEVKVRPVITYLNGSYWSIAFAQNKSQEYAVEELFGIDHDSVDIIRPVYLHLDAAGIQGLLQIPMDTADLVWMPAPGGTGQIAIGLLDEGSKERFMPPATRLFEAIMDSSVVLSFEEIDSLLDVDSWVTYLSVSDYGRLGSFSTQVTVITAPGKKMFLMMNEADVFGCTPASGNHWTETVLYPPPGDSTFTSLVYRRILLRNPEFITRFLRRYQDLLNTYFTTERTYAIANGVVDAVLPEYRQYWDSWYPNAGLDSASYAGALGLVKLFCLQRTGYAWQQAADVWLPQEKYTLAHRRSISLVLDSLPQGLLPVYINTLRHDTSWTGLYLPKPSVRVSMDLSNVPPGSCFKWKEYPDSSHTFFIHADSNITLTPVRCAVTPNAMEEEEAAGVSVWPNPATREVHIGTGTAVLQQVTVYSPDGKKMMHTDKPLFTVQHLSPGMYVVLVHTDGGTFRRKLLVSR